MAFGVKRINLFTYTTPTGGEFSEKDTALIGRDGVPDKKYFYVKKINKEFKRLSSVLFGYEYSGTYVSFGTNEPEEHEKTDIESLSYTVKELSDIESVKSTESIVIGEFKKGEKRCYLFVNYTNPDFNKVNGVNVRLKGAKQYSVLYNGKTEKGKSGDLFYLIDSGKGFLLILE